MKIKNMKFYGRFEPMKTIQHENFTQNTFTFKTLKIPFYGTCTCTMRNLTVKNISSGIFHIQ